MFDGPGSTTSSHATGLDRNELGAILVAAGLAGTRDHALFSLLALNGLRISEALGADVDALGLERGHRTLTVCRKGKIVTRSSVRRRAVQDAASHADPRTTMRDDRGGQSPGRHATYIVATFVAGAIR